MGKKGISLRYKLMAALVVIPIVGLSIFLLIAKNIFEKDKIAYVFDTSLSVSKTRAARVGSEISSVVSIAQAIVLSYRSDTKDLSETGNYYFERETKFDAFRIFAWNPDSSNYSPTVNLNKPSGQKILAGREQDLLGLVDHARSIPVIVKAAAPGSDRILMAVRFGDVADPHHIVAVVVFDASDLSQVFTEQGSDVSFLSRRDDGIPIFTSIDAKSAWGADSVLHALGGKKTPEGIEELTSPAGVHYLASFSEVGVADLIAVSLVEKKAALAAVDILLRKSILFFIAIIAFTAMIAVIASRSLTSALTDLSDATRKISEGDFTVRVEVKSRDEIGSLAEGFNAMAGEVARLMSETAEKARMEAELATAKTVQDTLFPQAAARVGPLEIAGHYVPASECGGDWWHYCEIGGKVFIWIGDATGHGAPAALLTSAARAVASVLSMGEPHSVSDCLMLLNQAIFDISKGRMMMTFFLAAVDSVTGEMAYSNASHEPPLLLHRVEEGTKISRDDFIALNEINNPRLGERTDVTFTQGSIQLYPGDRLVFYTDGVVDVKNGEDQTFGERRFMKALAQQLDGDRVTSSAITGVVESIESFRAGSALGDDVTLILVRYWPQAAEQTQDPTTTVPARSRGAA